ncbi:hypothetical protein CVE31_28830, partial [Pseudomonas syringae pv. actinidiae]|nr:hypothetical protein [Pseudomonas syringae pv. actinidiae]
PHSLPHLARRAAPEHSASAMAR